MIKSKRIDWTQLAGFGLTQDAMQFMQTGAMYGFEGMGRALGHLIILHGVVDQGASVTDGFVMVDGELLPFVGGAKAPQVWIEEVPDVELFGDSSQKPVYTTRRARMGIVGSYNLSDFRPFKTDLLTLNDSQVVASAAAVKKLHDYLLCLLQFEIAIILKGCTVDNLVGDSLEISAGVVMMDNNIISTQAYQGMYPIYLTPTGAWSAAQPAGTFIKFDPYTSQRYADVLKRATTSTGEIKLYKTLSDRFDGNGVGRWEMEGFRICDDLQSRVPLGYDRRQNAFADPAWDSTYNVPGATDGKKKHQLTINEMPRHRIKLPPVYEETGPGTRLASGNPNKFEGGENYTDYIGGDEGHENRQPFLVVVYAERI